MPTQSTTANLTTVCPPNTQKVHRTIYQNASRDQLTLTQNPQQDIRLITPQQRERQLEINEQVELQRRELALHNTQEIIHDYYLQLQTPYSKKKDSDEINSENHKVSPVNSVLDFSFIT